MPLRKRSLYYELANEVGAGIDGTCFRELIRQGVPAQPVATKLALELAGKEAGVERPISFPANSALSATRRDARP